MQNRTAFIFVLLANLVLLAHAVIPHHHHQKHVCIESTHCINDVFSHTHDSPEHNHEHDGTNSDNCCNLKQAVFITSVQSKLTYNSDKCSDNHHHDFIDLSKLEFKEFHSFSVVASYIPEISFSITSNISRTLGSRASPVV